MRKLFTYSFALFSSILLLSCESEKAPTSQVFNWPKEGIAYEIFVQSFCDSDGDSIGDVAGMTSKLDYLKDLGVDAIWLMPINPSPSYHKYDVTDYKDIHPDYGTMDDFKTFVEEAHKRNIHIVIDFIINHSSSKHPWFLDAKSGPDAKYRDYYVWANKDSIADQLSRKEISFDSDNIRQWHPVDEDTTTTEYYYGFFNGDMPDLNYDNPVLRNEIFDIGKFWLQEIGVDGFRMDAAKHIYPDDRAEDNHAFWVEFKSEMQKINPEVYVVGEVWANTKIQAPFSEGFTSLFDFDLAFSILESVKSGKASAASISGHGWVIDSTKTFIQSLLDNRNEFQSVNPDYVDAIFLSNHDQNRVISVLGNDVEKAKLAASIMMTLPGTPYLYYGEEIGLKGMKPDPNIREPFLWKPISMDVGRTKWMNPEFTTDDTVIPLSEQIDDSESIFNHYKQLIEVRKNNRILTLGNLEVVNNNNENILSFVRTFEGKSLMIMHNLSDTNQSVSTGDTSKILYGDTQEINNGTVIIPGLSSMIIAID